MNDPIPAPSKTNRWVLILIVIGLIVSAFFGLRAFRSFAQIRMTGLRPGTTDVEAIRGWMTVPYIAKTYAVPQDYLYQKINVPAAGSEEKSLGDLSREYYSGQPGLILQKVRDAIRAYKPTCEPRRSDQ